jgi:hypothetical protein
MRDRLQFLKDLRWLEYQAVGQVVQEELHGAVQRVLEHLCRLLKEPIFEVMGVFAQQHALRWADRLGASRTDDRGENISRIRNQVYLFAALDTVEKNQVGVHR